jgi:hypothetical protein
MKCADRGQNYAQLRAAIGYCVWLSSSRTDRRFCAPVNWWLPRRSVRLPGERGEPRTGNAFGVHTPNDTGESSRWSSRTLFEPDRDSGKESTDIPLCKLLAAVIDLVDIA